MYAVMIFWYIVYLPVVQECVVFKQMSSPKIYNVGKWMMDLCNVSTSCYNASDFRGLKGVWKAYSQVPETSQRNNTAKKK